MLRRIRFSKLRVPWWLPALAAVPAAAGLVLIAAGSEYLEDWRICLTLAVLFAVLAALPVLRRLASDASKHRRHHRRTDRQLGVAVAVTRAVYECEGRTPPAGLDDEREQRPGADVVRLKPRGAGPRHSRARSRRQGA